MEKNNWAPRLTTQFLFCPVPFHLDTYHGCEYNCSYCFARIIFNRNRKKSGQDFNLVKKNNPYYLAKWFYETNQNKYGYDKGERIAFKERIPLKIGANSDPFPTIEKQEKVTYSILKELHEQYDYPIEIQTKNPIVLSEYADKFDTPNWSIAVTIISLDDNFVKSCEPNAPTVKERLEGIKQLSKLGLKVMVKIQPAIFPKILDDLNGLVENIKMCGAWAFNIEGLKVNISAPFEEQQLLKKISDNLGFDIRENYKRQNNKQGINYHLSECYKLMYIKKAESLAKEYNMRFFVADNFMGKLGDGPECCGTEILRNYKLLKNIRTNSFIPNANFSTELEKCLIMSNWSENKEYRGKTIAQAIKESTIVK